MLLSNNIRYLRKQQGLSQEDLARAVGMKSFSTIQKWEDGSIVPPMKRIETIADYFHKSVYEMLHINIERQDVAIHGPLEPSPEEAQSLMKFRALPPTAKKMIRAAINAAYEDVMLADAEKISEK